MQPPLQLQPLRWWLRQLPLSEHIHPHLPRPHGDRAAQVPLACSVQRNPRRNGINRMKLATL